MCVYIYVCMYVCVTDLLIRFIYFCESRLKKTHTSMTVLGREAESE